MAAQKKNNQGKGQVSPVEKVRLRVSAMISSPRAQAERRASIWKAQGDSEEAWQQVLEELAETEGLEMTRNEDGTVLLTWQPSDEEELTPEEEASNKEMVVQHLHEEFAPF
ncbi:TPA: DUF1654 domain-containing protein [Pseudomonas aeruginosa]|uniref:DUF1654 domain-containing protein n=1 Tax=Pseudomonas aeruginosa TaxID=287 RepID=UPI000937B13E|nr:DUF1654 domain-containing protein [Pseudomonas aeruginosa]RQH92892.1 DUF1654 domain-containing protein [Pseudomonas aeruginosa]HBO5885779.1 DUF1654 domain-containing protein [Pseudomonas aeruginosa]HBO5891819.1 DUF1654 domain-containing protein [Pseudomonas aeruginosa]HBO8903148.1 DUF1654 domain-containing protein [Pseudomonas aeruginosa]HBO8944696.1 DUF1654 domain-containing protein [Pseudomonas aeruginosa]